MGVDAGDYVYDDDVSEVAGGATGQEAMEIDGSFCPFETMTPGESRTD